MDSRIISNLEDKIDRAVKMIRGLKNEKEKQQKEKEKLRQQLNEFRKDFEEYKKNTKLKSHRAAKTSPVLDSRKVKERLKKLAGKLAALEDSWN
jgi:FtsZ-binding cell division protein ZapB